MLRCSTSHIFSLDRQANTSREVIMSVTSPSLRMQPSAGFGSFKSIAASAAWLFSASVAASRVAAAVRNHKVPVAEDLTVLGLDAKQFPRF
jgi:hypothetical protein